MVKAWCGGKGSGSFRPRVVSALSRFGRESFRPGSSRPESFRPWVVSANFSESFRPDFLKSYTMLYFRYICYMRLVNHSVVLLGYWDL